MAAGREVAVLGDTLQWAAFEGRKFGILAFDCDVLALVYIYF